MVFINKKIGITFGGGAAKGIAHIGVIKCLQENNIEFDVVTGNSAGSIAGALYSYGCTWKDMKKLVENITAKTFITRKYSLMYNSHPIETFVEKVIGRCKFPELKKDFTCVAADIRSGNLVVLSRGKVSKSVRASCCIPGIFKPTPIGNMLLVDGCIINSIPTDICRNMGADYVISVDLNADRRQGTDSDSFLEIVLASFNIMVGYNAEKGLSNSDCVISPDLDGFEYHKLDRIDELIEKGEEAAYKKLPKIKEIFNEL